MMGKLLLQVSLLSKISNKSNSIKLAGLFLTLYLIGSSSILLSQNDSTIVYSLIGGYKFYNDNSYQIGIGVKRNINPKVEWIKAYSFNNTLSIEKFIRPLYLKENYAVHSRSLFEFKFIALGCGIRIVNFPPEKINHISFVPVFGLGYKYVWIIYEAFLPLKQIDNNYGVNSVGVKIDIPVYKLKR